MKISKPEFRPLLVRFRPRNLSHGVCQVENIGVWSQMEILNDFCKFWKFRFFLKNCDAPVPTFSKKIPHSTAFWGAMVSVMLQSSSSSTRIGTTCMCFNVIHIWKLFFFDEKMCFSERFRPLARSLISAVDTSPWVGMDSNASKIQKTTLAKHPKFWPLRTWEVLRNGNSPIKACKFDGDTPQCLGSSVPKKRAFTKGKSSISPKIEYLGKKWSPRIWIPIPRPPAQCCIAGVQLPRRLGYAAEMVDANIDWGAGARVDASPFCFWPFEHLMGARVTFRAKGRGASGWFSSICIFLLGAPWPRLHAFIVKFPFCCPSWFIQSLKFRVFFSSVK